MEQQPHPLPYEPPRPPSEPRWFRWLVLGGIAIGLAIIGLFIVGELRR